MKVKISCVIATRPPQEEIIEFLRNTLKNYGPIFIEKLFGRKTRKNILKTGGVGKIANIILGDISVPAVLQPP